MHEGRRELAAEGERLAAEHLARAGYRIVARNVRADGVEIDMVATRGELVVFVEVKTRAGRRFGAPEEAVDLTRPECLRAILRHLQEEAGVRGIVLVHDREKAYGSRAMAALNALLALARLLDQFGQRAPAPNFPGFTAKEILALFASPMYGLPHAIYRRRGQEFLTSLVDAVF